MKNAKATFESLTSALRNANVPARIKLTDSKREPITIELGFDYPDSLCYKVDQIIESLGIEDGTVSICAETSGDTVLQSTRVNGGAQEWERTYDDDEEDEY